jgi:hypothetical protein
MKQGISRTAVLWIVLGVAVILIFAIAIYQQREKTEETVFKNTVGRFLKFLGLTGGTETARIQRETGCTKLEIDGVEMLAQAAIDCHRHGMELDTNIPCCYKIDPAKLTTEITQENLVAALAKKGHTLELKWTVEGAINNKRSIITVCFDDDWDDDVFVTLNPAGDCS